MLRMTLLGCGKAVSHSALAGLRKSSPLLRRADAEHWASPYHAAEMPRGGETDKARGFALAAPILEAAADKMEDF
jgi:hypothetical protein